MLSQVLYFVLYVLQVPTLTVQNLENARYALKELIHLVIQLNVIHALKEHFHQKVQVCVCNVKKETVLLKNPHLVIHAPQGHILCQVQNVFHVLPVIILLLAHRLAIRVQQENFHLKDLLHAIIALGELILRRVTQNVFRVKQERTLKMDGLIVKFVKLENTLQKIRINVIIVLEAHFLIEKHPNALYVKMGLILKKDGLIAKHVLLEYIH